MSDIVIEIPEKLKSLEKPIKALVEEVDRRMRSAAANGRSVDYGHIEATIAERVMAVERTAHANVLAALDVNEPQLVIDGKVHTQVLRTKATYRTMGGPVSVLHSRYRPDGERNAPTVDPVSLRAGVVGDGWLPGTATAMAHAVQMTTSRDAAEHARQQQRLPYSRSSFEDVAHLVGDHYVQRCADIDAALIERLDMPCEAHSVSVSLDRVSVAMEEPREHHRIESPRKDPPKRSVDRVWRMAYCGTVTLHDARGEALHTIRYGRMSEGDVIGLVEGMAGDVLAILDKQPTLKVAILADGAPELWNRLDVEITPDALGVDRVFRFIDFWHVIEKLGAAARLIDGDQADATVRRWKMMLLNTAHAVPAILHELRACGREAICVGDAQPVHDAITYLENNCERMHYTLARHHGLPIGSGAVEATCKSLVETRMKRPGARWKQESGEHVIQLRALALSDRWDDGVELALKPLRKPVRRKAA